MTAVLVAHHLLILTALCSRFDHGRWSAAEIIVEFTKSGRAVFSWQNSMTLVGLVLATSSLLHQGR